MAVNHVITGKPALDRQLRQVTESVQSAEGSIFAGAVAIRDVSLGTTEVSVRHALGRRPEGWIVIGRNAAATVYESSDSADSSNVLNLTASSTVVVDLLVL